MEENKHAHMYSHTHFQAHTSNISSQKHHTPIHYIHTHIQVQKKKKKKGLLPRVCVPSDTASQGVIVSIYTHLVVLSLVISNSTSAHLVWLPRSVVVKIVGVLSPVNHCGLYQGQVDFHKDIQIVERIDKAEIRQEEQSEKAENCCENLWNDRQLKGP